MRVGSACGLAAAAFVLTGSVASAQSGEITVWSWNIAASSLKAVIPGFNVRYPDVKVTVEDLGNQQVFDKTLAGCAAGGAGLPDVVSIEYFEAELFWGQFTYLFV
jgi:lactose/L-arabinose transport system substrate-binding protein